MTTHPPSREVARAVRSVSVALMIIAAALWAVLAWQVLFRLPHCLDVFADFDTELPQLTQLVAMGAPWLGYVMIALAITTVLKEFFCPPNPSVILNGALIALALGLVIIIEITLQLPMYNITAHVVQGGP